MPKPTFTAEECRKNARDFREFAKHEVRPVVRETMLEIARLWERLAVTIERQRPHDGTET
jgi:hypothetical protein